MNRILIINVVKLKDSVLWKFFIAFSYFDFTFRASFPVEVQIQHVMRCLTDHNLPKNKPAILDYFIILVQNFELHVEDFRNASLTRLGISRLVNWVYDPKNSEDVRQKSQLALVLLNEINCKEFVAVLESLGDQDLYDKGVKLISCHPKRPSVVIVEREKVSKSSPVPGSNPRIPIGREARRSVPANGTKSSPTPNDENLMPRKGNSPLQLNRRSIEIQNKNLNGLKTSASVDFSFTEIEPWKFAGLSHDDQREFLMHWSEQFQLASKT